MTTADPLAPSPATSPEQPEDAESDKTPAWNACPTCGEIVDIDEENGDGSEVRCMACNARLVVTEYADDTFGLVLADEGDDDEPDPLDPETPEAAIEEQARALGLDPAALRRRGEEIGRSLRSAAEKLTAERLDELDRRAREAAERARKATVGPWESTCHRVVETAQPLGDDGERADVCEVLHYGSDGGTFPSGTATFIAAAREDVPVLSAAVLALSAEVRRLREERAEDGKVMAETLTALRGMRASQDRTIARAKEMLVSLGVEPQTLASEEPPRAGEEGQGA